MKKISVLFILLTAIFVKPAAQSNVDLQKYSGRYVFSEDSPVEEAVISIVNDTVLHIAAIMGESDLKHIEGKTFVLSKYGGTIEFNSDASENIQGFTVSIPMIGVKNLKAQKERIKPFETHAHRGNRGGMPENTVIAMIDAIDKGVTTLEMDLQISRDKKVIVSHDAYFNEKISVTPEGNFMTRDEAQKRLLYAMDYDSISKYDVGIKPNPDFPLQKNISAVKPLLSELLEATEAHIKGRQQRIEYNIEIKSSEQGDGIKHPSVEEFVDLAMRVISEAGVEERSVIQSFDNRALLAMHRKYPHIKLSLLIEGYDKRTVEGMIEDLGFSPEILSPEHRLVTSEMINYCHSRNIRVIPWTVNDESQMLKLKEMGVDGIISDYPERLVQIR